MKRLSRATFESKWYVPFVLAIWTFAPEVRRVVDYNTSYHSLSIINFLPAISLMPGVIFFRQEWSRIGSQFRLVAALWLAAFGYAFLIAALTGSVLTASYDVVQFCFPYCSRCCSRLQLATRESSQLTIVLRFGFSLLPFYRVYMDLSVRQPAPLGRILGAAGKY